MRAASKSPDAFRTISEVASDLDVPQHVLRFWETKFAQVKPLKRAGGRRYYRPEDLDLLRGIRTLLYTDGFTIKGVQKVLREQGIRYVMETGRMAGREDRALPVTHSGSLDTSEPEATTNPVLEVEPLVVPETMESAPESDVFEQEDTSDEIFETPILASQERVLADQPIEPMGSRGPVLEPELTTRQRATLESILEELLDLRFTLNGAKKTLGNTRTSAQQDLQSEADIPHVA